MKMEIRSRSNLKLRVRRRSEIATGVLRLELEGLEGQLLPEWEPGAHVELELPSGIVRQYSLCGPRSERGAYVVCVLREPGGRGGSEEIHRELVVGTELVVFGPRNHFRLTESQEYLLIAGGIGITPIKAMVDHLRAAGATWHLHYGGRTRTSMAFVDDLLGAGDRSVTIAPQDEVGLLDVASIVASASADASIYCCGPAPLIEAVASVCATLNISDRLHFERFEAPSGAPGVGAESDAAFEVELKASGVTLHVPADTSLLEIVRTVRPDIPFSCTEGYCGSCESVVLEGQPDHRGSLMTAEEHDQDGTMLICVGRSRSPRLVLDL